MLSDASVKHITEFANCWLHLSLKTLNYLQWITCVMSRGIRGKPIFWKAPSVTDFDLKSLWANKTVHYENRYNTTDVNWKIKKMGQQFWSHGSCRFRKEVKMKPWERAEERSCGGRPERVLYKTHQEDQATVTRPNVNKLERVLIKRGSWMVEENKYRFQEHFLKNMRWD